MKFMSWTLSRPSTTQFNEYYKLKDGEPWYSNKYELVNKDAFKDYANKRVKSFVETLENHPEKFYAMGMHEFGISDNGDIFNMGYGQIPYPNGYYYNNPNMRVLNDAEDDIERPVPTSLRYFMHKYPNIRWALQFLATANSSGDRVTSLLNNTKRPLFEAVESTEGTTFEPIRDDAGNIIYVNAQDEFIRQSKRIAELYIERGFPIADIEIDMEKTWAEEGEDYLFSDLLARVKREVCIPLGLGLRVNLFAMTGEYNPSYYGWHNYSTVAKAEVNGEQAVDEFQLMTYDFSWGGSSAGASTPLWWLKEVLEHVKELEEQGLWDAQDVYIGNAGYGRRWPLNEDRMGVTFDFKQMVQMQNGLYIHNDGEFNSEGNFPFRNQDFIPFAGFNDSESDYQINYPHVYDRFLLTSNGGAVFEGMNRPQSGEYVTNYSLTQHPTFTDVLDYKTSPDSESGRVENRGTYEMINTKGDLPIESWNRKECIAGENSGSISYNLDTTGTFNLLIQLTFPFYDANSTKVYVNGEEFTVSTGDWYSFSLLQRNHFYNLGEFTHDGTLTVEFGSTDGVIIGGVVASREFSHGLTGGKVHMESSTYPFFKRGNKKDNGDVDIVKAQFPDSMDLVAEVLRRPPRPVIIWEDVFTSHVTNNGEGYNLINSGYYDSVDSGGYTSGEWLAHIEDDYSHARVDSTGEESTFTLYNRFQSNLMAEFEVVTGTGNGSYGISLMSDYYNGYRIELNHAQGTIEVNEIVGGSSRTEYTVSMSQSLKAMQGYRLTITAYVLNGKLSFKVNDRFYIQEYEPSTELNNIAYGFYINNLTGRLYRYSLSSLDRYERMERIQLEVDGEVVNTFGGVNRDVEYDEYGYIKFTGYPASITEAVPAPDSEDGQGESVGDGASSTMSTILDTETEANEWGADYSNEVLASIAGWQQGKHDVTVKMIDVGIWFKRFYVGDSNGMSISYNSDKVAFIRTAELIRDYNCRGIGMWTLGQEDTTIYSYLPDMY